MPYPFQLNCASKSSTSRRLAGGNLSSLRSKRAIRLRCSLSPEDSARFGALAHPLAFEPDRVCLRYDPQQLSFQKIQRSHVKNLLFRKVRSLYPIIHNCSANEAQWYR